MNFSLRTAVILATLIGLLLPASINGLINWHLENVHAQDKLVRDQKHQLEVLALGMQDPLWNLAPEAGKPLLDSLMRDERVVRVVVNDAEQGVFLSAFRQDRRLGNLHVMQQNIEKQGLRIGNILLEYDDGLVTREIREREQQYLLAVTVQVACSLFLVLFLLESRVLKPVNTLSRQSSRLTRKELDQPFTWRRNDEVGQLGQSLEATRQALKGLIQDLEQKNLQLETDLISRRQIESALRVSQDRFRRLAESTRVIPWDARPEEWRFTYVGPLAEELLGYPLSVWYSEGFLANYLHPDDRHLVYPLFADNGKDAQQYEFECRLIAANGKEVWVLLLATAMIGEDGEAHLQGALIDINQRKQAQMQQESYRQHLEDALEQRSRALASCNHEQEVISASISQDLRAPLRAIDGFSQVLLDDYQQHLDANARNYLMRIRSNVASMASRIDDLLMLCQISRSELHRRQVDLSQMAQDIIEELTLLQPERPLELTITPNLVAHADPKLTRIVLYNLLDNAWKFTQNQPVSKITLDCTTVNRQLVFYVADNGAGFDMDQAKQLFMPFFHLHQEGQGNGIGLTLAQRIIHRHNGRIWAKSIPGEGSTFYFTLPEGNNPLV